jgi:hypothetical protein
MSMNSTGGVRGGAVIVTILALWVVTQACGLVRSSGDSQALTRGISDNDISSAIERRLRYDLRVPSHQIEVETAEDIVTLSGSADSVVVKERAVQRRKPVPVTMPGSPASQG